MDKSEPGASLLEKGITNKERGNTRMNPMVFSVEAELSVWTHGL